MPGVYCREKGIAMDRALKPNQEGPSSRQAAAAVYLSFGGAIRFLFSIAGPYCETIGKHDSEAR